MSKTTKGLVEYALAQLGKPYWYGTYGQIGTEELYEAKKKQYPNYYKATDFSQQFGQRVHDCSGLIDGYLMSDTPVSIPVYKKEYDYSANGLQKACIEKGDISTIPDDPGVCVFYNGHVGVYIGDGFVIEARGHKYGVEMHKISVRPWKTWGYHPLITKQASTQDDAQTVKMIKINMPVLKKGMKNIDSIITLQRLLVSLGYKGKNNQILELDGSFGGNTDYALRNFQQNKGLVVDGSVGKATWSALLSE